MTRQGTLMHKLVRHLPAAAAVVGMIMILGSIVFFFETDYGRIAGVASGMFMLLGAVWYAANPLFKNTRRGRTLAAAGGAFITLVTKPKRAAVNGLPEEIERTSSAMHESIERMVAAAGKTK